MQPPLSPLDGAPPRSRATLGDLLKEGRKTNFKRYMCANRNVSVGVQTLRPKELSSLVLKSLKADAEAFFGETVRDAVIAVPAYFRDAQRKATRIAGELAGLNVPHLVNKPTAASLAYGVPQRDSERKFLIFDLGGGTFDVSVLDFFEGVMEVRANTGDNFLRGEDFTEGLIELFHQRNSFRVDSLTPIAAQRLHQQAERAKRLLTQNGLTSWRRFTCLLMTSPCSSRPSSSSRTTSAPSSGKSSRASSSSTRRGGGIQQGRHQQPRRQPHGAAPAQAGRSRREKLRSRSAGRMGGNPYDPLTTTSSHEGVIMADANHKARPPVTERSVTIQESWRYQKPARLPFHMRKEPATFPWMKLSGRWIETAGFEPGSRVRITVEHQKLIITPL
jgi:hypothetical protein